MAEKKFNAFLEALKTSPLAKQKLQDSDPPKSEEEKIAMYLALAKEIGFDLTTEDLKAYLLNREQSLRKKTDAQAQEIQKLDDDELAQASGGVNKRSACKYTYSYSDDCWINDKCDRLNVFYPDSSNDISKGCVPHAPGLIVM